MLGQGLGLKKLQVAGPFGGLFELGAFRGLPAERFDDADAGEAFFGHFRKARLAGLDLQPDRPHLVMNHVGAPTDDGQRDEADQRELPVDE